MRTISPPPFFSTETKDTSHNASTSTSPRTTSPTYSSSDSEQAPTQPIKKQKNNPTTVKELIAERYAFARRGAETTMFFGIGNPEDLTFGEHKLIDHLKEPKVNILEIGSAEGETLTMIQERFPKSHVTGLTAKKSEKTLNYKEVCEDAHVYLESREPKFDLIFSNNTFIHFADPLFCLQESLNKLNPNGTLLIDRLLNQNQLNKTNAIELITHLSENGFDIINHEISEKDYLIRNLIIKRKEGHNNLINITTLFTTSLTRDEFGCIQTSYSRS